MDNGQLPCASRARARRGRCPARCGPHGRLDGSDMDQHSRRGRARDGVAGPSFDPVRPAPSHAHEIANPTPRRTAYDAVAFDFDLSPEITLVTQRRASTWPICYTAGG
jgi:hypothetical protein